MTIAWAFPGQGSQKLGMADEVISLKGAIERFKSASEILGRDLLAICRGQSNCKDELGDLNDTRNTQPAMFVIESLLIDDLKRQGRKADLLAGHSLGEFVALYAAEVFDVQTGLVLLKTRSELMSAAGGGAMTAVLGFDRKQLEDLVGNTSGVVIANDNSSEQVVLSGTPDAVNSVAGQLTCKRIVPLKVSGAFHSPFMKAAANDFALQLDDVLFSDGVVPVLSNVDPSPVQDGDLLKERLKRQMITGVRWRETMKTMETKGVKTFVEIGPGKVLSGLAKRSMQGITLSQVSSANDLGH
ncbi:MULTISPECIES: ACP S-malonyltransferase [Prochlorococcus]|uniref:Malonyl CoA-acyl carrier protein transacylase n=1 Tax=Prochlorococcus marinus (strain SARG / CCMP1375 / SS120) TaxID=167539 RepID=Q7VE54_PROMA|nr:MULTISPECIES: ACP S-malonyltransferase [Prochlorococcus]AAP99205.1 (acyl-carrier-protein) S-malonyltransferase [Prochlorococcus marinus subsp. marinus str. CCMP1375]KGG11527.1 Malonyl CoA-acyl carrier protein transacylase [Prochlorococcus marinus str. LG]KGG18519.1 Malonyl CoA-acyl carrier protein transacylase [Prochlorococcus marinus str. SS2]KGG32669.1 Malonyl CoA-acyl carrier protein transacylase [Prochlorococcus marinus str. SS51]KGG35383.1 Malonyl CoA-acyl carrier protein transacylase 